MTPVKIRLTKGETDFVVSPGERKVVVNPVSSAARGEKEAAIF
jgi:hypothetical protein